MSDVLTSPGPLPDAVVRYAEHPDGLLDLHLPAGTVRGLLVLVHGGFWRAEWDRRHTRWAADALREEGWLVATPEYRRTGATGPSAGGWPRTGADVLHAVEQVPGLLAGMGLDAPAPLVTVGHSAGGHLALWLAARCPSLAAAVALAPVGDLRDAERRDLDGGAVRDLLGGGPGDRGPTYDDADPASLWRGPGSRAPVVVLHGTADRQVPVQNAGWMEGAAGIDLRLLDGVDHFALVDPGSAAWPEVLRAVGDAAGSARVNVAP